MAQRPAERWTAAAITRLDALAPLCDRSLAALEAAIDRPRRFRAKREILGDGQEIAAPLLILNGWAARQHLLEDGRRQIIGFLLPGDVIGYCDYERPVACSLILALTDVDACAAPDPAISPALARAYALGRAYGETQLCAQVTRTGRMNAQDRMTDLLLELLERLEVAGLAAQGRFAMPLTQEVLADAVGLTSVHVNRTLQTLRRMGVVDWKGRDIVLSNPDALRRSVGRVVARVTAA